MYFDKALLVFCLLLKNGNEIKLLIFNKKKDYIELMSCKKITFEQVANNQILQLNLEWLTE